MVAVVHRRGKVAELHGVDPFVEREVVAPEVWWCDVTDAAIVLGSRQRPEILDREACDRAGLTIAGRRSGGGAVVLRPDDIVWIDAVMPHGVAPDDVRGSMVWVGERWCDAIGSIVGGRALDVHRGGMICTPWSNLVCFAGLGPGEVQADGVKLVGLSQRRTRHGLRVQGLVHRRSSLREMPALFAGPVPTADIGEPATLASLDPSVLCERLAASLDQR